MRCSANHYNLGAQHAYGFTLLEVIIVLAIVSLLTGLANPPLGRLVKKSRVDAIQSTLRTAVYTARTTAISINTITTLCPYGETGCSDDWNQGLMLFTDHNNDQKINDEDKLLDEWHINQPDLTLTWRASGGRNFLRYSPSGMAREFGQFTLCDKNNDPLLARGIVVNRNGRLRIYRDRNGDGIVENINGDAPDCR